MSMGKRAVGTEEYTDIKIKNHRIAFWTSASAGGHLGNVALRKPLAVGGNHISLT
jgi:hypothetical protein